MWVFFWGWLFLGMFGSDFWFVGVVLGFGRLFLSDFGSLFVFLGWRFVGKFLRIVGGI